MLPSACKDAALEAMQQKRHVGKGAAKDGRQEGFKGSSWACPIPFGGAKLEET